MRVNSLAHTSPRTDLMDGVEQATAKRVSAHEEECTKRKTVVDVWLLLVFPKSSEHCEGSFFEEWCAWTFVCMSTMRCTKVRF